MSTNDWLAVLIGLPMVIFVAAVSVTEAAKGKPIRLIHCIKAAAMALLGILFFCVVMTLFVGAIWATSKFIWKL